MTNERPCFACAYRRVGPMSGWEYCGADYPVDSVTYGVMPFCDAWRQQGGACGPEGRLFQPLLLQPEEPRRAA